MTSRERVYRALNFQEPDRVPICFGGHSASTIEECPPYARVCSQLYEYLGITGATPKIGPVGNIVASPDDRVLERLHSDMHALYANAPALPGRDNKEHKKIHTPGGEDHTPQRRGDIPAYT